MWGFQVAIPGAIPPFNNERLANYLVPGMYRGIQEQGRGESRIGRAVGITYQLTTEYLKIVIFVSRIYRRAFRPQL